MFKYNVHCSAAGRMALSAFLGFIIIIALLFSGCSKSPTNEEITWQEQYDLAVRYLSEGNYEEAIIAFTAAIEIDPKNPDTYISLAKLYMDCDEVDKAYATLERGYSETKSNEIQQLLEEISSSTANTSSQPPDISLNEYGAIPFEQRKWYVDPNTLSSEQLNFLDSVIEAVESEDRVSLEMMAAQYLDLFSWHIYTQRGEYKICVEVDSYTNNDTETGYVLQVELRSCSGAGYYVRVCSLDAYDTSNNDKNIFYHVWTYSTCPCVDWQPHGSFIQTDEGLNIAGEIKLRTDSGIANAGVIVGEEICQDGDYTFTNVYENGHLVRLDGLTEAFWGPLSMTNAGTTSAERIWW